MDRKFYLHVFLPRGSTSLQMFSGVRDSNLSPSCSGSFGVPNFEILRISYKDHVTSEEVRAKIQQAIGPHEDLLTIGKRRKLQWYGHVSRSSGLAKTILQGTVKGGRRQGDRERGGKTTSGNGQAWSSASPRGQWRTGKNGGNWLRNHLWCPSDPRC